MNAADDADEAQPQEEHPASQRSTRHFPRSRSIDQWPSFAGGSQAPRVIAVTARHPSSAAAGGEELVLLCPRWVSCRHLLGEQAEEVKQNSIPDACRHLLPPVPNPRQLAVCFDSDLSSICARLLAFVLAEYCVTVLLSSSCYPTRVQHEDGFGQPASSFESLYVSFAQVMHVR